MDSSNQNLIFMPVVFLCHFHVFLAMTFWLSVIYILYQEEYSINKWHNVNTLYKKNQKFGLSLRKFSGKFPEWISNASLPNSIVLISRIKIGQNSQIYLPLVDNVKVFLYSLWRVVRKNVDFERNR